jgi:hypothetical protein
LDQIPIENPWLIVYQPDDASEKLTTILAGPENATYQMFGILIADIAHHVARRFGVDVVDVMEWAIRELRRPTTEITGGPVPVKKH